MFCETKSLQTATKEDVEKSEEGLGHWATSLHIVLSISGCVIGNVEKDFHICFSR